MKLSVALGKSLSEVAEMSAYELAVYEIADQIQPIGEFREDLRNARLINEIRASGGRGPKTLKDLLIEFDPPSVAREKAEKKEADWRGGAIAKQLAARMGLKWMSREEGDKKARAASG